MSDESPPSRRGWGPVLGRCATIAAAPPGRDGPGQRRDVGEAMSTPPADGSHEAGGPAILMVDDDGEVRQLLRLTLARGPYRLLEAATGEQGLELARRWRPRLILLDVQLPGIDGLEVCRRLKADPELRAARVLMLTAAASEDDRARGAAAGADGYLTKPFGPLALLERIELELGPI